MTGTARHDTVIIGGGASGALTAWNLATRHAVTATLIDPADRPGTGLAYSTPSAGHLLNVPAKGMSADPDDPEHFLRWLGRESPDMAAADAFLPRALYGRYLRHLYGVAAPIHVRQSAVGCRRVEGGFSVTLANGEALAASRIVLCCGHFAPARLPGAAPGLTETGRYHHAGWSGKTLEDIPPDAHVMLFGTGLTATDMLIRLREQGHRGRVTGLSRRGRFPERHASSSPLPAPAFCPARTTPTAREYLHAFRAALKNNPAGEEPDWRATVDSLRPVTNALWGALPAIEKTRFRRHLQRRWDQLRHRVAPQVADIVAQECQSGRLHVARGRVTCITAREGHLLVTMGDGQVFRPHHIINCTGPDLKYQDADTPLLHDLFARGEIVPGFGGAGLSCTPEGALINAAGMPAGDLFTVGPARLGTMLESIAIPEIRQQARQVADRLASRHTR